MEKSSVLTPEQLEQNISQRLIVLYQTKLEHQLGHVSCKLVDKTITIVAEDSITGLERFLLKNNQYELAKQQMKGACGLVTFIMKASNIYTIETFCNSLKHILMAVSWGGYESLIIPRCAGIKREKFNASSKEHRMVRLYVGLEDRNYIVNDLSQAFAAITNK